MAVAIFGLVMVASLSSDNLLKGLLMGALGMFLGTVGMDPHSGYPRFTFEILELVQGISVVPLLIGVFSIPEVIRMLSASGWASVDYDMRESWRLTWGEIKYLWKTWLVSTGIGMVVGIIPAIGPETATFVGYDQAKKMAKDKSLFGKGDIRGIAGSEAAEAVVGTSLAPMFALGIPGSGAAMALMGGLLVHGLMPGPKLFTEHTGFLMTVFMGFMFAQVAMLICGIAAARFAPQILRVPHVVLGPIIIVVSMVGSFAINNSMFDVGIMLVSGIIAHFLGQAGFAAVPVVLGLILGPMFEGELARTLTISAREGFVSYMMGRPIALLIIAFTILTIVGPIISEYRNRKQGKVADKKNTDNV
jgi:putative tricarboxylic transport membrane protein